MSGNRVHITRTRTGYDGEGELSLGKSRIKFEGHLDEQELRRLAHLAKAGLQWVEKNGRPLDTSGFDFLEAVNKGVEVVGNVAKSPIGDAVATFGGPYGALAVAAARGAPDAVKAIKGVLGPAGPTAAVLSHPDPKVREKAKPVVDAIVRDAEAGNPEAVKARLNLTSVMIKHKDMLLAERGKTIEMMKDRLAIYGDPLSYADTAGDDVIAYGFGDEGPPVVEGGDYYEALYALDTGATKPAASASLHGALDRALQRAKTEPQPTFKRPAARR